MFSLASSQILNQPSSNELCLHLCTTTWARDSHELFDYETTDVKKKIYFINSSLRIFRTLWDICLVPEGKSYPNYIFDYILSIREKEGRYVVLPLDKLILDPLKESPTIVPKKLWLIVKNLPNGQYRLQEGDIIKLGRFKLKVKQLVRSSSVVPEIYLDDVDVDHTVLSHDESINVQCRICLLEGGNERDPLVCPCQCKGSIKYIHLNCLRRWVNGRLSLSDTSPQSKLSFFIKQIHCELCKTLFPSFLSISKEKVPIINIPKIDPPFIVLENIVGSTNRGYHIISLVEGKELKLGRGHESDVRIADVSISRYHATIRYNNEEFTLEDHNSKFGTLVCLRRQHIVDQKNLLVLQVGRTVLELSMRPVPCHFTDFMESRETINNLLSSNEEVKDKMDSNDLTSEIQVSNLSACTRDVFPVNADLLY